MSLSDNKHKFYMVKRATGYPYPMTPPLSYFYWGYISSSSVFSSGKTIPCAAKYPKRKSTNSCRAEECGRFLFQTAFTARFCGGLNGSTATSSQSLTRFCGSNAHSIPLDTASLIRELVLVRKRICSGQSTGSLLFSTAIGR